MAKEEPQIAVADEAEMVRRQVVVIVAIGFLAFILKTLFMCWLQLSIRWTLPRFRYDQVMKLGWRVLGHPGIWLTNTAEENLAAEPVTKGGRIQELADVAKVESEGRLEGKSMTMILTPK